MPHTGGRVTHTPRARKAIFRTYRYGQKRKVFVYRLVSWGTMEERIYKRQIRKQSRAARAVDSWQARPRSWTVPGRCRQNVSFSFPR